MKNGLLSAGMALFLMPQTHFAQAPNLGTTASFAFFTAAGAVTNTGATYIIGNIGTHVGTLTGFSEGTVLGQIYIANTTSNQAAIDVNVAYTALAELTCGTSIGTTLGNNQTLTPNIYCLGAATTLTGDLILDGQGNPNAVFIFKIDGALSTSVSSKIILTNSASLNNVYWQITGAVVLAENSLFKGTIISSGAITLLESAALMGRGLTRAGAISLHNNNSVIVLPIDLMYFSGQKQDAAVLLNWAIASEINNVNIELQKSFNARDFETVVTFKNRETKDKKVYSFLDNTPFQTLDNASFTTVYYRLKQIDANPIFEYSKVISIAKETKDAPFLYPNPTSYSITAKNIPDAQTFTITDVLGKTMMRGASNSIDALDISQLPSGYYCLSIQAIKIRFFKN